MKKILATAMQVALALAVALTLGVQLGVRMQAGHQENISRVAQSGRIAVVNQDLGAEYMGEEIFFAANIIETLGEDYTLVSRAMAESGLGNGNFAAVIYFPADFSQKVTQINAVRPEAAMFSYQLNTSLSQSDAIRVLLNIIDLEQHINETVGFMFMASILGELHDAQATAGTLLANNQADLNAVGTFVTGEMIPGLSISQMDRNLPEIDHPDFLRHIEVNSEILTNLNSRYSEYMDKARTDYAQVTDSVTSSVSSASEISDAISSAGETVSGAIEGIDLLPGGEGGNSEFDTIRDEAWKESQDRFEATALAIDEIYQSLLEALGNGEDEDDDEKEPDEKDPGEVGPEGFSESVPPGLLKQVDEIIDELVQIGIEIGIESVSESSGRSIEYISSASALGRASTSAGTSLMGKFRLGYLPGPSLSLMAYGEELVVGELIPDDEPNEPVEDDTPPAGSAEEGDNGIENLPPVIPEEGGQAQGNPTQPDGEGMQGGNAESDVPVAGGVGDNPLLPRARADRTHNSDPLTEAQRAHFRGEILGIGQTLSNQQQQSTAAHLRASIEEANEEIGELLALQMAEEEEALSDAAKKMTDYVLAQQDETRSSLLSQQAEATGRVNDIYTNVQQRLSDAGTAASQYDPSKYISENQDELTGFTRRFSENNSEWSTRVNEAVSDRTQQVYEVFTDYDEYVWQLQDDMRAVTEETGQRLGGAQENLLLAMIDSSSSNNRLIGGFETVLPNSRIGAQGNSDFYAFVVSPVNTQEVGLGTHAAFADPERRGIAPISLLLPYIMMALLGSLAVVGGIRFLVRRAARRKESENVGDVAWGE